MQRTRCPPTRVTLRLDQCCSSSCQDVSFFLFLLYPLAHVYFSRRTHPGWRKPGPAPLCPAAPERFPAGAGGTDALAPGPGGHRGEQVRLSHDFTEPLIRFRRAHLPACTGQRAPDRRTPASRWLCRPSPAPAPAPACGRKRPCRSPAGSGTRCPGCCRPAPPLADSPASINSTFFKRCSQMS